MHPSGMMSRVFYFMRKRRPCSRPQDYDYRKDQCPGDGFQTSGDHVINVTIVWTRVNSLKVGLASLRPPSPARERPHPNHPRLTPAAVFRPIVL